MVYHNKKYLILADFELFDETKNKKNHSDHAGFLGYNVSITFPGQKL